MRRRSYLLDELSWTEVRDALRDDPRLILPIGALEQHGPHLPLGANTHIARAVAREVSERLRILRAPALVYGTTSAKSSFPGSTGLTRKTLHRSLNELLARWEDSGVRAFILVTAHRHEPHLEALLMALTGTSTTSVYDLYRIDVADLLETNPEAEHAGELETSLMLHLAPDLVVLERMHDFDPPRNALRRYMRRRIPIPPSESEGVLGFPTRANAEKGAAVFRRLVDALLADLGGG